MTRRQALQTVVKYLDSIPELDEKLCKAKEMLQEMRNGIPGKIWCDETVHTAIQQFIDENGRPPKVKELDTVPYLPPHPSIQNLYKMGAKKWLTINYPTEELRWMYSMEPVSLEQLKAFFIQEYNDKHPTSAVNYNKIRCKTTPSWQYIARALSVSTWTELKHLLRDDLIEPVEEKQIFEVLPHIVVDGANCTSYFTQEESYLNL